MRAEQRSASRAKRREVEKSEAEQSESKENQVHQVLNVRMRKRARNTPYMGCEARHMSGRRGNALVNTHTNILINKLIIFNIMK